jgi:hypothetical protein
MAKRGSRMTICRRQTCRPMEKACTDQDHAGGASEERSTWIRREPEFLSRHDDSQPWMMETTYPYV